MLHKALKKLDKLGEAGRLSGLSAQLLISAQVFDLWVTSSRPVLGSMLGMEPILKKKKN